MVLGSVQFVLHVAGMEETLWDVCVGVQAAAEGLPVRVTDPRYAPRLAVITHTAHTDIQIEIESENWQMVAEIAQHFKRNIITIPALVQQCLTQDFKNSGKWWWKLEYPAKTTT